MNLDRIQELFEQASADKEQDSFTTSDDRSIVVRQGPHAVPVDKYEIDMNTVSILDFKCVENEWDESEHAIISFSKGYALVSLSSWWDYTFNGTDYRIEINENNDWGDFVNFCLTDEMRDKFRDLITEKGIWEE